LVNKKLTRKEENDFYRAIMAYGVETNTKTGKKNWDRFKALARLDKKYDDALDEFYTAFMAACKKATGASLSEEEEICPMKIDTIEESKAKKVLARVDLIRQIRDDALEHPKLNERMLLCEPAIDMPDWWISGKHDKDLLQGVARHGMARMDYYVLNDAELSFKDILKRHLCNEALLDKKAAAEYEKARTKAKNDITLATKFDFEEEDDELENVDLKKIKSPLKAGRSKGQINKTNDDQDNNDKKEVEDHQEDVTDENNDDKKADQDSKDEKTRENKDSSSPTTVEKSTSKTSSPEKKGIKRSASVSISPPQITLQQMEQMAKGGIIYDMGK
jgi:chromodomain-helicase-DNA-binding protein 7